MLYREMGNRSGPTAFLGTSNLKDWTVEQKQLHRSGTGAVGRATGCEEHF